MKMSEQEREAFIAKHGETAYNELRTLPVKGKGRPVEGESKKPRAYTVGRADHELLLELGNGNASAGLRTLIERYRSSLATDGNA